MDNVQTHNIYVIYCCYVVDVYTAFTPPPATRNWTTSLCSTFWSTLKCTVPRHMSCILAAFQFYHFPNNVSLSLYEELKLQYSNSIWPHGKLNTLCISAKMQMFYRTIWLFLDSIHRLICGSFTKDHNISETGSVSVLRWMGQDRPTQLGPSEKASLNHWTQTRSFWRAQLSRSILPHPSEDGDRISLRNVVVFCKILPRIQPLS
jgi:hypothetical protein